jgi:hypothetical protein
MNLNTYCIHPFYILGVEEKKKRNYQAAAAADPSE